MSQPREPKGVPSGGRFTGHTHPETGVDLSPAQRTNISYRAEAKLAGLRHQRSLASDTEPEKLRFLADRTQLVSVVAQNVVGTVEQFTGRIRVSGSGGFEIVQIRRQSVVSLDDLHILDVVRRNGTDSDLLNGYYDTLAKCPTVTEPSFDQVPVFNGDGEPPSDVAAVYVLDHPGFGDGRDGRGVVFFATDRDPEEAIVNGYMVCPGGSSMFSEHGSMFEGDIARFGGQVAGYQPGQFTFSDAAEFGRLSDVHGDNDIEACWDAISGVSQ